MTVEDFKDEILTHYTDQDDQVTVIRDPFHWSTGNGLLHAGIFYTILGINHALGEDSALRFNRAVNRCWVKQSNQIIYGLLNRNEGRPDKEAHDDYIGVCAGSYFCSPSIAQKIVSYGHANYWAFDNTNPFHFNLSSWHGRFPGLVGFYQASSGGNQSLLQYFVNKIRLSCGLPHSGTDTILTWLQVQVFKASGLFKKEIVSWEEKLFNEYGNLGAMFAPYFGSSHPFGRIAARGIIGAF